MKGAYRWSQLPRPIQKMLQKLRAAGPKQCEALAAEYRGLRLGERAGELDSRVWAGLDATVRHRLEVVDHDTDVHGAALGAVTAAYCRDEMDPVVFAEHTAPWVAVFGPVPKLPARLDWSEAD